MLKRILFAFLLPGVLLLIGCANGVNEESTIRRSFLRTETTEEGEQYSALYYIVDPATDHVSVLNSMEDEFEYSDLEHYEFTEETIRFSYDETGMEMTLDEMPTYHDSFGNTYRMNTLLEEN